MIPEGYAQVTLGWTGGSLPTGAANVFGVETSDPTTPLAIATAVRQAILDVGLLGNLSSSVAQSSIRVKQGPTDIGPSGDFPGAGTGGSAGQIGASQLGVLVQKVTAFGGRSGKGRLYIPGAVETGIDVDGSLTPAYQTTLQTVFANFRQELIDAGFPMVVFHRPGSPLTEPTPVTSMSVQDRPGTQRRRNRR